MATIDVNTLIGTKIYRMQRGRSTGTNANATVNIPISAINLSKSELFLLALAVDVNVTNGAGGTEVLKLADALVRLTSSAIVVTLPNYRIISGGNYVITWEIKEWN